MGGCRCTFRECTNNSSNSPGMHFFHYPYKDGERCKRWAQYSGNMAFLSLETAKLRNKVVCETHFRDENFMNYKKERLVQQAIPTLVRLKDGTVLDYEESENPKPKVLSPTNLQHLVPPQTQNVCVELYSCVAQVEKDFEINDEKDNPPPAKITKISTRPRILNVAAPQNYPVLRKYESSHSVSSRSNSPGFTLEAVPEPEEVIYKSVISQETIESVEVDPEPAAEVVLKSVYDERELEFLRDIENLRTELALKENQLAKLAKVEEELKEAQAQNLALSLKPNLPVTQVETITTSRKMENAPNTPLTKAQLFNGIRKYLTPSIASMVRMEMFGGPEREWKQDEKNAAVELLSLGEHVFDYIRDEWRCRLPPKRDVELWLGQRGQLAEEEDL